jgi:hypothetical protein
VDWNGPLSLSAGDLSYTSELDCSFDTDATIAGSACPDQEPDENRDLGDGENEFVTGDTDVQSVYSFNYPPSISPRELRGCLNPAFVDSIAGLESEDCSREHKE